MARTRVYRNGVLEAEGFPVADISDRLAEAGTVVWLDLCVPDQDDLAAVSEEFALHPLAVEDAIHQHQRPKLDRYQTHLFLSTYAVGLDTASGELQTSEIAVFITKQALITVRKDKRLTSTGSWPAGTTPRTWPSTAWGSCCTGCSTSSSTATSPPSRSLTASWRAWRTCCLTSGHARWRCSAAPLSCASRWCCCAGRPADAGGRQRPHAPRLRAHRPADGALLPGHLRPRPARHGVDRVAA